MAAAPIREGTDDLAASRRTLRDLAALLALPAMWVDHEPTDIVEGLLGVLFAMLRLESAYARFDDPEEGRALESWRPYGPQAPIEFAPVLAAVPVSMTDPSSDGAVRITSMTSAFPGEHGLVLVGSRRCDFPTDHERHLLRVAVGQATIAIHTARRLASERAARVRAEESLRRRNAFLATLAQDLNLPLAAFAEWAAQARAFATETDQAPTLADVEVAPVAVAQGVSGARTSVSSPGRLTRREAEVLGLLAQGLSNKEIAAVLWLSERTIERHITGLYRKIAVQRRSEATAYALRHGFVDADAQ